MKQSDILACFSAHFKVSAGNGAPWINLYIIKMSVVFQFVIYFMGFQSSNVLTLYQRMAAVDI